MNEFDSLLDIIPLPEAHLPDSQPEAEAAAYIAAALLHAEAPVDWLNQLADALEGVNQGADPCAEFTELAPRFIAHLQSWRTALATAQRQQAQAYADLLPLGSQPDSYPRQWLLDQTSAHRALLTARFGEDAPGEARLASFRAALSQRQLAWQGAGRLLGGIGDAASLRNQHEGLRSLILQALLAEVRLQCEEGQIPAQALATFEPLFASGSASVLEVRWQAATVPNAWVIAPAREWAANLSTLPLLLWVHGEGGGLFHTQHPQTLRGRLAFTLTAPFATALGGLSGNAEADSSSLGLAPLTGGLCAAIDALIEHWAQRLEAAEPGLALEQALDEARGALAIPVDATRQQALASVERQWQADALAQHMPAWLLARTPEEREAAATELAAYHQAAAELELWLSEQLPAFPAFAGQLLAERIEQDLGIAVNPEQAILTRPVSVTFHWFSPGIVLEPPPMGTFLPPLDTEPAEGGLRWIPSDDWETLTLAQLATENLDAVDEAEVERLNMARWQLEGISAAYLLSALPALDPLKQYEELLRRLLDPALAERPERLRVPYERELLCQARMAHWQHRLSEEGLAMVRTAAAIHDASALADQGLRIHWLVIHAKEERGEPVQGCCALVDIDAGRTVLCLPSAPAEYALLERDSLAAALSTLCDGIRVTPALADYVAHRLGGEPLRWLSYFRQAAQRRYEGYLTAPASLGQTLVGMQLHDRRAWLQGRATHQGRSQRQLLKARNLSAHHRDLGYLRAGLAVLPGVGTLIGLQDIYDSSRAAAAAWHRQDAEALGAAALGVAAGVLDVLLSVIPVASTAVSLRQAIRAHVRARGGLQVGRSAFAGYEAPLRLRDATPLFGRDAGSWRSAGEQYIWQDGRAYAVYRRAEENTLRLRATATRRYEAPVRREGERWVVHAETGLRGGGGKLTDAEQVFATWGPGSAHAPFTGATRPQALQRGRRLLGQYQFPNAQQATEFACAYLADGTPPAWALGYRTGAGAAPAPSASGQGWQAVRWSLGEADEVIPGLLGGEVSVRFFENPLLHRGVRWEGQYYPLVPHEASPGAARFITPAGRPPAHLQDLDDLIRDGRGPVRVLLGQSRSQAPQIIGGYTETFAERLARRFPDIAADSRQAWGQAIYHHADPQAQGLTQRRLLALEGLLNDPASDPLQALAIRRIHQMEVVVARRNAPNRFDQLRWALNPAEEQAIRRALAYDSVPAAQAAIGHMITRRGYQLLLSHATPIRYLSVLRNPRTQRIYILVQHTATGPLQMQANNGVNLLSAAWMDLFISGVKSPELAALLRTARAERRLHPLLGGVLLDGPRPELVWERVRMPSAVQGGPLNLRSWRDNARALQPTDLETTPGSGLYRQEATALVEGARVEGRWVPLFPAEDGNGIMLTRPSGLPSPLTFDALEQCLRERFAEQPWIVSRAAQEWTIRRPLFLAPLDRQVSRVRPGITRPSALNAARAVFERAQGQDHARLLRLEHVLLTWIGDSTVFGELADPLLMLTRQHPIALPDGAGWQLALPGDIQGTGNALSVVYLQPVEPHTRSLVAALGRPRMRHHAPNVIDDMLRRYGLVLDHRAGGVAQYRQPATNHLYLVALQVSEGGLTNVALDGGVQALSSAWIAHWQLRLEGAPAEALQLALAQGRVVRLVATLRLDADLHGSVAIQRLADL
ncbi:dermonecrotic toxin domain-containing protein [Pseudomonas japonica]|uniref:dermonecrotic toxin domain-containing protein n=1 Tax=Pseudomonas japonica TaxID=256466 RepID=UPI0015E4448C|nr:DUF6543 domain-containing protein [Pseudomonas japonica]MBA1287296.1 hypothetical protein [Pseudomonas japonica]